MAFLIMCMLSFPTTDFDFFLLLPQRGVGSHELAWERTGKSVCIGEKIDKICEPSELCMFMIDMGAIRQSRAGDDFTSSSGSPVVHAYHFLHPAGPLSQSAYSGHRPPYQQNKKLSAVIFLDRIEASDVFFNLI